MAEATQLHPWQETSQEEYDQSGRLDVNIKIHVKVMPTDSYLVVAYGTNLKAIASAELPSDMETRLEKYIEDALTRANLHVEKMVIV